jgi:hypothetical protein
MITAVMIQIVRLYNLRQRYVEGELSGQGQCMMDNLLGDCVTTEFPSGHFPLVVCTYWTVSSLSLFRELQ